MNKIQVTFFPKLTESTNVHHTDIQPVLDAIKSGGDFNKIITACRKQGLSRSQQNKIKEQLPGIGFSGTFSKRANNALIESSGLMMLDFDKTLEIPTELLPFVFVKFISPTGTGIKVLIKIPLIKDDAQYKTYFLALQKEFPTLDPSGKDVSRLTYMSWDPNILINEESQIWNKKIESAPSPPPIHSQPLTTPKPHHIQSNWAKMLISVKMIQQAPVGNRHESILKAGKLMGGYIAGGEVQEQDIMEVFKPEIYNILDDPEGDFKKQWQTFLDGIKYGKEQPIKERERARKGIKAEFRAEDVYGDAWYTAADSNDGLDDMYKNGNVRGVSTGWPEFDKYYSVMQGFFSIFYGRPFASKTKFLFELLVNLSKLHDWKHLIFSPETGAPLHVYAALIQIHAGGDMTDTYLNQIPWEKYQESKKWVNEHFLVVDGEINGTDFTLEDFLVYVKILENKFKTKFHTITGDPLIEFRFDDTMRDDLFWNQQLKIVRVQAKMNNWHVFLVTHTIKSSRIAVEEGNQVYPIPDPDDIAGGQTFYRKGFQIVCFYRHLFEGDMNTPIMLKALAMEFYPNSLWVIVKKTKPEGMGKLGKVHFRLDIKKHHFIDSSQPFPIQHGQQIQSRLPYKEEDDIPDFQAPGDKNVKIEQKRLFP